MDWDHSSSFPLFGEHATREQELEEMAEGAGKFCGTLSKDPCRDFIRSWLCGMFLTSLGLKWTLSMEDGGIEHSGRGCTHAPGSMHFFPKVWQKMPFRLL